MFEKYVHKVNKLWDLAAQVKKSDDVSEELIKALTRWLKHYIKIVTVHTCVTDRFSSHFKLKNKIEVEILSLNVQL